MRITAIILLVTSLHVSATAYTQRVTIHAKNMSLEQALGQIKKQTGYSFLCEQRLLEGAGPMDLIITNATLNEALDSCISGLSLTYTIKQEERLVFIMAKPVAGGDPQSLRPPGDVRGHVVDSAGNALAGATVAVRGTNKVTITNASGDFILPDVEGNTVLLISYTGYQPREIRWNGNSTFNITLTVAPVSLQDVVVNKGYYNIKKQYNTGNVSIVKGEEIQRQPVSDPMMALEGRVPGLYISQTSGIPGASLVVRLRGKNSIANGNDPLYIVDGVPFTSTTMTNPFVGGGALNDGGGMSPFANLNPSDIESIEVLKDADATAIYGSRGANGVILITTRKGRQDLTKFDLNVYSGAGKVAGKMHLLNTQQYLEMRHEALKNDGRMAPGTRDYDINGAWDTTRYTDWQKELTGGTAHFTNVQGTLSGGNSNIQFLIGGGYNRQGTVFPGDYADEKISAHLSLNHVSVNQKLHAELSAGYINDKSNLPAIDFTGRLILAPDAPALYNADGSLNWQNNTFDNPMSRTREHAGSVTDNLISNLMVSYELLPGLKAKSVFGYTHIQNNQSNQSPLSSFPPSYSAYTFLRSNYFGSTDQKTWNIEPQLSFERTIGQLKLDVLAGATFRQTVQNASGISATDFTSDVLIQNPAAAATQRIVGVNYTQYNYNAVFGRLGVNWLDKYLLNFTARRDGSSRFGPGNQFGDFGALGAAWLFAKERWIRDRLPFLNFGKLRASYGTTGNDQIPDYMYLSAYSSYYYTYQDIRGLYPTQIPNPFFGWESVKKLEFGLETGFFKDRVLFNVSFYRNRTGNQLVGFALPSYAGFTSVQANLPAVVQNTGLELDISTVNIKTKDFSWTSSANLSIPRNKLISYPNLEGSNYRNTFVIGQSIFAQKYYHYTGLDPQTGLYTVQDVNKDNIINADDYQLTRQITQNFFGGFNNSISYKGLRLDVFFQFVKQTGQDYLSLFRIIPGYYNQNVPVEVMRRWQKPGDVTDVQKFSAGSNAVDKARGWYLGSDAIIRETSFIRLKNLSLSYSFPAGWCQKVHLKTTRLYFQAQNLLTITSYKGLDPETQSLSLPPLRMLTVGIQAGF
ncbi:MAG: SusC/RagA family TonB-linked outer membrane protein [Chitinophagaceae bacterium]|nr:SusC/RagA family TonB-linked outer membrane protein [Chitinophagaceae bacterium]